MHTPRANGQIPCKQSWFNRRTHKTYNSSATTKYANELSANGVTHQTSTNCRSNANGSHNEQEPSRPDDDDSQRFAAIDSYDKRCAIPTKKPWNSELNISILSLANDIDATKYNNSGRGTMRSNSVKASIGRKETNGQLYANALNASENSVYSCDELSSSDHVIDEQVAVPHRKRSGTWP